MMPILRVKSCYTLVFLSSLLVAFGFSQRVTALAAEIDKPKSFRAGAHAIEITPTELPVIVNGGMSERTADKVEDPLHARCLVLDDGANQIAIVIVDSCMMPRALLDEAKRLAQEATKIPANHILISATHTHSAPSVYGCLGTDPDPRYTLYLPGQLAKGISQAQKNLAPARIGWAVGRDEVNVASRRWLMKPGVAATNPFSGGSNDRAQMHPQYGNSNAIRPTNPVDPEVPVVSVQTKDGKPLAVLTNYSMHYVGAPALSADYFAVVCQRMTELIQPSPRDTPFVAIHSNGTSGDAWLMDYTKPKRQYDRFTVANDVAQAAFSAYQKIKYYDWAPIVMEESLMNVGVRVPSAEEVAKAKEFVETFKGRKPKTVPEVYARETVILSEMPPTRELKLQAIRIGDLGMTGIPNEVFSVTGILIKRDSPLKTTFNFYLANGCEGYLPPPDQLELGGYETWRARTSCLEKEAEPKIRGRVMELLESVAKVRANEAAIASK